MEGGVVGCEESLGRRNGANENSDCDHGINNQCTDQSDGARTRPAREKPLIIFKPVPRPRTTQPHDPRNHDEDTDFAAQDKLQAPVSWNNAARK